MRRTPALALVAIIAACSTSRTPVAPTRGEARATCIEGFQPSGSARADVIRLGRRCGETAGLHALTPVQRGRQGQSEAADMFAFAVGAHGGCLRVFAAGGRGVTDLDLLVRTAGGEIVAGDLSDDAWPVLPPAAELCLAGPAAYVLEIGVMAGTGEYAVQVWGR